MEHMTFVVDEVRAAADGRTVSGVAVPFGQVGIGPKGREVVKPGAFKRTLNNRPAGRPMKVLRNHEPGAPVGVAQKLVETPEGLLIEVRMADTAKGDETLREIRAGVIDAFSIGFTAVREAAVNGIRELREVALHEVSLVSLPAYPGAVVTEVRTEPPQPPDLTRYLVADLPPDVADWC